MAAAQSHEHYWVNKNEPYKLQAKVQLTMFFKKGVSCVTAGWLVLLR